MQANHAVTAVVLVHFGEVTNTLRCLDALACLTGQIRVVVSNNGDPAQGEELAKGAHRIFGSNAVHVVDAPIPTFRPDEKASVFLLPNSGNLGFAGGCNQGIRLARRMDEVTHIWLLNNDARPAPGALEALLRGLTAKPSTVLGSTVVRMGAGQDNPDSDSIIQVAGGVRYSAWSTCIRSNHQGATLREKDFLPDLPMDYAYGASLFCTLDCFEKVGLLDEDFFLFYEELDFCRRARRAGIGLDWCRDSVVAHKGGASMTAPDQASPGQRSVAAFHEARSTILFTRKHYPWLLPLALAARLLAKPLFLIMHGDGESLGPSLHGVWKGLTTRLNDPSNYK